MSEDTSKASSDSSASSNTGGRAVQFGDVEVSADQSASDEEDEEVEGEEPEEGEKFNSWNEWMRHQEPQAAQGRTCLENLISKLFIVTVEGCMESLTVLRKMYGMHYVDVNLEYVPLEGKYDSTEYDVYYPTKSESWRQSFKKLRTDICWLEKIMLTTITNLRKNWNFETLVKILHDDHVMREEGDTLLSSKLFNQHELIKLRLYEEAERAELVMDIQEVTEELGNVKDELNDNIVEYDVKIRYLKNWENARYEQNKIVLTKQEDAYSYTTKTMTIDVDRENRVHEEFEAFLDESLRECQEGIEDWMTKYDAEIEQFDEKIQKLKVNLEVQRDDYTNLMEKYDRRKQIMEDYKQEKLRKQKEAEEQARRVRAATRIQSWWRGVMFRKGLGPWRRKKGKGKKGGSAKDSSKKKNK